MRRKMRGEEGEEEEDIPTEQSRRLCAERILAATSSDLACVSSAEYATSDAVRASDIFETSSL